MDLPADHGSDVHARIDRYLTSSGLAARQPRIVPLTGDASDRRYLRVLLAGDESVVLAVHSGPIVWASLPFANVASLLEQIPLPTPRILGHSDADGIVCLEDLGDVTLQAHLGAAPAAQHAALYREAVGIIERLQRRGRELASPVYLPYGLAFDVEKLTWELEFFTRHFLEAYRGISLSAGEREALTAEWLAIASELAAEPRVLCHRDFHSRNLMFHRERLYVIDFQDARLGPDTYDLVSLLRDSYVDIEEPDVEQLIADFRELQSSDAVSHASGHAEFRRRFDLMAIQRNLKALGTFGYQATTRGNPVYVQYIPRTLAYARFGLVRYARFERLRSLLAAHVNELR